MLSDTYTKFYSPSEHLPVDEVILLFKVIFKQYIPKKHKHFGIKIYKLLDMTGYGCDMSIYLGKDRQNATQMITGTHVSVKTLTRRVNGVGLNFYMDNFSLPSDLFHDLHTRVIICCGNVRQKWKECQEALIMTLKLKWDYIHASVKGFLIAMI
jgi:hypothetical protein